MQMRKRSRRVNYLSNKILLKEIHTCKIIYNFYEDEKYTDFDLVVLNNNPVAKKTGVILRKMPHTLYQKDLSNTDINMGITAEHIIQAKKIRALRINEKHADSLFYNKKYTNKQCNEYVMNAGIKYTDIPTEDIVIRFNTNEHIPEFISDVGKVSKLKVNFPPFKHYAFIDNKLTCVGISHSGKNKEFNGTNVTAKEPYRHRRFTINNKLGNAFMLLVDKYGKKGNWRGYSWNADMKADALVRLIEVGLKFDEGKGDNPFAWYTTVVNHAFTATLNKEKGFLKFKHQQLVENGLQPTFSEQAEMELNQRYKEMGITPPDTKKMFKGKRRKQKTQGRSKNDRKQLDNKPQQY